MPQLTVVCSVGRIHEVGGARKTVQNNTVLKRFCRINQKFCYHKSLNKLFIGHARHVEPRAATAVLPAWLHAGTVLSAAATANGAAAAIAHRDHTDDASIFSADQRFTVAHHLPLVPRPSADHRQASGDHTHTLLGAHIVPYIVSFKYN